MGLFKTHKIGNMWYAGIMDNQASFAIFDSEYGWNPVILEKLTGVSPKTWPAVNQAINGEFLSVDHAWEVSTQQLTKAEQTEWDKPTPYSGAQMLKLTVPDMAGKGAQLYLQTFVDAQVHTEGTRTLLHVVEGVAYKISSIAGTDDKQKGSLTVKLRNVKTQAVIEEFPEIKVSGAEPQTTSLQYKHNTATVDDVRLEFEVGSKAQVLYLDNVQFIRDTTSSPAHIMI